MDLFRAPTDYLDQAEALLKKAIQTYDREEERKRIAEQARLEEAARQERARLEQEAAAREAAAQAEARAIQRQAEQAAAAGDVEAAARLSAEAESRVEQGAAEVATLQTTATLITAPIAAAPVRTAGVSTRKVWKAVDIGMRMLTPRELARAQGFPDSYVLAPIVNGKPLSKSAQVRMIGNSVCPDVATALIRANFAHEQLLAHAAA
ncbi:DNA cytosine methyltransferase [Burkholderia multivorans]|uniref:DNA cytosine methyltransferase n=1 Tax=Burkholderia multivorans TaxID=87883 RepID=UPI001E52D690